VNGASYEAKGVRHFDGRTAEAREATVRLAPGELSIETHDGAVRRWPLDRVRVMRAERTTVQLELTGEPTEAVILEDAGFLAALRAANGGRSLRREGGLPALPTLVAVGLLGLGMLFAAWRWGIPALAGVAADQVPVEWERRFGAAVVSGMAPSEKRVEEEAVVGPVRGVFDLLAAHQASTRDSFTLIVLRDKMVNAFAAPGGYVTVTTGLLGALRGPDELAAVLAHEIAHVTRRHTTRGLFARLGVRALFALIAGDASGLGAVVNAAGTLGELSYSRGDELDADAGGIELLARAGIDPGALDRALETIGGATGRSRTLEMDFLSTHPSTAGRREQVRRIANRTARRGAAALPNAEAWEGMKRALAAPGAMGPSSP